MSAGDIGIVEEELVAIEETRTSRIPLNEFLNSVGGGRGKSQVTGARQDHRAFCGIKRCHAFAALRDDRRGGHPLDGGPSFLTDRPETMKERFIFNRIETEVSDTWHGNSSREMVFRQEYEREDWMSRLRRCCGLLLQPRHDFSFEEVERVDHLVVMQVADMEHAHEVIGADLFHLVLDLLGDAVGVAG